ncbi:MULTISPECIES: PLD nuclease N-terminal domain-containing protein [unclassified Arthrobacter]|uniref:PLD nuclease N-terminal domain-containing protein n=1 Tax=unclassified Arthrobacter TaxID=235627 RepID=UPI00159DD61D|nr:MULTISPECIES: PLD nuclease N-terminal domain-containing protein [unclassified Arthrobacter]MCQ9165120.1 PLD nuclease N-terminal domain-containing protein [Arthrobacter sp. STN4]NVM99787.1 PLDc_N domain-containing protein [Arthrobacter sp. SDTb3-6]
MRYIPVIFGVVLFIYGLIDCIRSESTDVRSLPKPVWILVIVLLPLVGVILWLFLGRPHYAAAGEPATRRPLRSGTARFTAPDDDPAFLRNLEVARAHKAEADRLRKLRAELDAREAKLREQHPKDETQH